VKLHLQDTQATLAFGVSLGKVVSKVNPFPAILLQGNLGSGKTTLVRGLVESLHGAELAEVSSPSFNIVNLYPTEPPVAHFDLYRLEGLPPDEALFEYMDDPGILTIIEWAQFLAPSLWPDNSIFLEWSPAETGRNVTVHATGKSSQEVVTSLSNEFKLK